MFIFWIVLIALGVSVLGAASLLVAGAGAIAYLATHPPRRKPKRTPAEFGARYEDVEFDSRDGVRLSGWFVPAPSNEGNVPRGVIILCHGMAANREGMISWAGPLWEAGFALLLFDFRALGESEGNRCTGGHLEHLDVSGAVDYLMNRPDMEGLPLGIFGFSMGGASAILAAADDRRVQAVATHGAFAALDRAVAQRCRRHFGPFGPLVERMTLAIGARTRWFPTSPAFVAPINAVSRLTPRPLLLLHGVRDRIVLAANAHDLYAAAGEPKALHLLARSGHSRIHRTLRQSAQTRLVEFFSETLCAPE